MAVSYIQYYKCCASEAPTANLSLFQSEAATATPDGISPPGRLSTKLRASASAPTLRSGSGDGATRVAPSQGKRKKKGLLTKRTEAKPAAPAKHPRPAPIKGLRPLIRLGASATRVRRRCPACILFSPRSSPESHQRQLLAHVVLYSYTRPSRAALTPLPNPSRRSNRQRPGPLAPASSWERLQALDPTCTAA